jgi:hypothetical protein
MLGEPAQRIARIVSAAQDDGDVRAQGGDLPEGFHAVLPGHRQVEQHTGECIGPFGEQPQGLLAVVRLHDRVAMTPQHRRARRADVFVVLRVQHRARAGGTGGRRLGGRGGKERPHGRAAARLALDAQHAALAADDSQRRGQSEPPSEKLGREKRLEDMGERVRIHPHAVVAHFNEHIVARRGGGPGRHMLHLLRVEPTAPRGHHDAAGALADRLRCVQNQTHHRLHGLG